MKKDDGSYGFITDLSESILRNISRYEKQAASKNENSKIQNEENTKEEQGKDKIE